LDELIQRKLESISEESSRQAESINLDGRIGPKVVKYDVGTHVGSFIVSNDRLGVNSQCNFGSIRANACVFKGNSDDLTNCVLFAFECIAFQLNFCVLRKMAV